MPAACGRCRVHRRQINECVRKKDRALSETNAKVETLKELLRVLADSTAPSGDGGA